jgi:DNA-binding response OmpR family regulator
MTGGVTRFGQTEFDAARGRLSVAGRPVELDRPCLAILSTLLGEAGKAIDKDRLLEAGWPGRVVHENSLAKAIGRLRQALGEDGRALETVHGYGYRLTVDLEDAADVEPDAAPRPDGPRGRARWRRPAFVGAALGLAVVAAVLHASMRDSGERSLIRGEPGDAIGRVLWVDDNPQNNGEEKRFLERRKIAVYQVTTSEEALALLAMYEYRAVISDMNRNNEPLEGIELVREMRRRKDETPFVLYTFVPSTAQHRLLAEAGGQAATTTSKELYAAILPLFAEDRPAKAR